MTKYLHTMIRVTDPDATCAFFKLIGLQEVRRFDVEAARFTLIFLAAPGQENIAEVELTYNWRAEDGSEPEVYDGGRNFGHLAYRVDDIFETCQRLKEAGHIITVRRAMGTWHSSNRPMASRSNCSRKAICRQGNRGLAWKIPVAGKMSQISYPARSGNGLEGRVGRRFRMLGRQSQYDIANYCRDQRTEQNTDLRFIDQHGIALERQLTDEQRHGEADSA